MKLDEEKEETSCLGRRSYWKTGATYIERTTLLLVVESFGMKERSLHFHLICFDREKLQ